MASDSQTTQAVPVGTYQIIVVHMDAATEQFGMFLSEDEAINWAMLHRGPLGLARCAGWRVECANHGR